MQTNFIFPSSCYWHFRAPNADEMIEKVNSYAEDNIDNSLFDWGEECKVNRIPTKYEDWAELYEPNIKALCQIIGKKFNGRIWDPWITLYERGSFQEAHEHIPHALSSVFFVNDGEGFSDFMFYDRNSTCLEYSVKSLIGYTHSAKIIYKAGDIIFFPAHMIHMVSPHNSDTVRKTLTTNIDIFEVR